MKKNDKILSISIAVYNLGEMIIRCLDSLVNSKFLENLDIILINDGSTDNTLNYIIPYVEKYPKSIKLIDKENEGAGSTVNNGIQYAVGKYFKMLDGDDWFDTKEFDNYLRVLINTDSDMVLNDYVVYSTVERQIINRYNFKGLELLDIINFNDLLKFKIAMHELAFRTDILKNNRIVLDNGFYTDQEYMLYPIPYVKTITYIPNSIYVYMVGREGQSMNIKNLQRHLDDHTLVMNHLIDFYEKKGKIADNNSKNILIKHVGLLCRANFDIRMSLSESHRIEMLNFVKDIKTKSEDIYNFFRNGKKEKILIKTNFLIYSLMQKYYIKKINN